MFCWGPIGIICLKLHIGMWVVPRFPLDLRGTEWVFRQAPFGIERDALLILRQEDKGSLQGSLVVIVGAVRAALLYIVFHSAKV